MKKETEEFIFIIINLGFKIFIATTLVAMGPIGWLVLLMESKKI